MRNTILPVMVRDIRPVHFASHARDPRFDPQVNEYVALSAQWGNAQAQFDRGTVLYDSVPRATRFRLALTPGRFKKEVPDALIEAYKWFSLVKNQPATEGHPTSWLDSIRRMIGKAGVEEANRRAALWQAEFEPVHRDGSYVDELTQIAEDLAGK